MRNGLAVTATSADAEPDESPGAPTQGGAASHCKRRKTSAAGFFADSDEDSDEGEDADEEELDYDELETYLALPQIKFKTERDATDWWMQHAKKFPNLAVMARQYLGCPASSAAA